MIADVRFGSLADILRYGSHVRFTPQKRTLSGAGLECPLSANSGHSERSSREGIFLERDPFLPR